MDEAANWRRARAAAEWPDDDEFSVSEDAVARMSDREKLAYLARLVRTVKLRYGLHKNPLDTASNSPAALLRGLNDITLLAVADTEA